MIMLSQRDFFGNVQEALHFIPSGSVSERLLVVLLYFIYSLYLNSKLKLKVRFFKIFHNLKL